MRGQSDQYLKYWSTGREFAEMEVKIHPMTNPEVRRINICVLQEAMTSMLQPLAPAVEDCFEERTKIGEERP